MSLASRIDFLLNQLSSSTMLGIDLSLDRIQRLLEMLGHPQKRLPPVIHVAGTNGKGSTVAFLKSIYEAAGYRVHTYTSPALVRFNERIVLAGKEISDAQLLPHLERAVEAAKTIQVTAFELITAVAFLAYAEEPADLLLLEVGLGGRLDATNLAENVVCSVLTPIAEDHREFLGDTIAEIAGEKAGILRADVPCVTAPQLQEAMVVILRKTAEMKCALGVAKPETVHYPLGLLGTHQRINAAVAIEVVQTLLPRFPVTSEALQQGLASAAWPARLQRLTSGPVVKQWRQRGAVMLDGGHNAHAAQALAAWIAEQEEPVVMLVGMMQRKDARAFFSPLSAHVSEVVCISIPNHADSFDTTVLAEAATTSGIPIVHSANSIEEAIERFRHVEKATVLIAGSLFLAGEILKNHG